MKIGQGLAESSAEVRFGPILCQKLQHHLFVRKFGRSSAEPKVRSITSYLNPSLITWTCFEVHFERMPHNKFVFFGSRKRGTAVVRGMMKLKVNQFVAQIFYGSYWTRSHQVQGLLLTILVPTLITTATPLHSVPSKGLKRHQKALSLSISICQVFKSRKKIQVVS